MRSWSRIVQHSLGDAGNQVAGRDIHNYEVRPSETGAELVGLKVLAQRFVNIYEWHNIRRAEMPGFIAQCEGPRLTLRDVATAESLLDRLDDDLLNFTRLLFGLHKDFLWDMRSDRIFTEHDFYKMPQLVPRFLLVEAVRRDDPDNVEPESLLWVDKDLERYDPGAAGTLYLLASQVPPPILSPEDNGHDPDRVQLGAVFKVRITTFKDRDIYRYRPFGLLPYSYWKVRYDVLSLIAIGQWCQVEVKGRLVDSWTDGHGYLSGPLMDICSGRRFPSELADFDAYDPNRGHFRHWDVNSLPDVESPKDWNEADWAAYVEWSVVDGD